MKTVSVIIPCFNEEAVLQSTWSELTSVLDSEKYDFEFIFVDDGSTDRTQQILDELASSNKCKYLTLSRNFGHQIAVSAGIDHASGDAIVIIDADLQDPPDTIWSFIEEWERGAEVVYGVRKQRDGESVFKLITAKYFYRLLHRTSGGQIPLNTGDFRLIDRKVAETLKAMPERDRFIRGMVSWIGFNQVPVEYSRRPRLAGETKYPLRKMIAFAIDGLLSFSDAPLKLAIWLGFFSAILSVIGIIYALVMRIMTDTWVPGWTLLFIGMMFMGGVQLLFLGTIGEYIARIYREIKQRPLYLVSRKSGFSD